MSSASDDGLRLSLLHRLIDDPRRQQEVALSPHEVVEQIREALRFDLQDLLNTRRLGYDGPEYENSPLARSLLNYGIPDFTGNNSRGAQDPQVIVDAIKRAILAFEPRLDPDDLQIAIVPNDDEADRTFRFRIDAVLQLESFHYEVAFDSRLDPGTGVFKVEGASR